MTKTLGDMEKRMAIVEKNIANVEASIATMGTKMTNLENNMEANMTEMKTCMEEIKTDMEEKFEALNNQVRGLKSVLLEGFGEMKDVLVKMEENKEENTRKVKPAASGDKEKENIIVAGGLLINFVEIFNWRQKLWSPLQSLPEPRWGATSFVSNKHVTIAGGQHSITGYVDDMFRMNISAKPNLSMRWSGCPVKLPAKVAYHSSVLYNDQLIVTGGAEGYATSSRIDEILLVPPYTVNTLSRMPEPRQSHSTQIFDDNLLIVGGRKTGDCRDNLSSVVLYDIKKNECKQLAPLPYEVSCLASVRWEDNIVVIGGADKDCKALDSVIMYNVKTEQHHMLPSMRCERLGCTAVAIGNNIVVLGGMDEQGHDLKSVEAFNFDRNTWEELPEMSQGRRFHSAVVL